MEIPITPQQLILVENRVKPIEQIVPHLTSAHLEFLMTGMSQEEWTEVWKSVTPPNSEEA